MKFNYNYEKNVFTSFLKRRKKLSNGFQIDIMVKFVFFLTSMKFVNIILDIFKIKVKTREIITTMYFFSKI